MFERFRQQLAEIRRPRQEADEHEMCGDWQEQGCKSLSDEINRGGGEVAVFVFGLLFAASALMAILAEFVDFLQR
jgi:hypothetical protein